jgi:hypothetical protein
MITKMCTDIDQSKKLAEILPPESADMSYRPYREEGGIPDYESDLCPYRFASWCGFPCWSLAALLDVLSDITDYSFELVFLKRTTDGRGDVLENIYRCSVDMKDTWNTESLDAIFEMIVWLKENLRSMEE